MFGCETENGCLWHSSQRCSSSFRAGVGAFCTIGSHSVSGGTEKGHSVQLVAIVYPLYNQCVKDTRNENKTKNSYSRTRLYHEML
jgi:hypothetical protein